MRNIKQDILHFWFEETAPVQWFQRNPDFDRTITARFGADCDRAADGMFAAWEEDCDGCLALCLLLDQFPRNMFRGQARAFAWDGEALRVAQHAVGRGFDKILPSVRRRFIYLPFQHSEAIEDQERSVALFASMRDDDPLGYDYAVRHREIIRRFGRFPQRNAALGRETTDEERAVLESGRAVF